MPLNWKTGGLLGAAACMISYPAWKASGLLAGAKLTLGTVPGSGYDGLLPVSGDILGIVMGLLFVALALVLPDRLRGSGALAAPAE